MGIFRLARRQREELGGALRQARGETARAWRTSQIPEGLTIGWITGQAMTKAMILSNLRSINEELRLALQIIT
jgi:hypothetical protein